jgi:peptidoglycan/LPS O-acetylase OafA/YrhL
MHGLLSLLDHVRPVASMTVVAYWLWIVPVGLIATLWSALSFRFIEKPFFAKRSSPQPAAPANGLHRDLA